MFFLLDFRGGVNLSRIAELPLGSLRKLVSEIRTRERNKENWQSWYNRNGSGQLLRQASTAVCILNEMIFGISDKSIDSFGRMFHKPHVKGREGQGCDPQFSGARSWCLPKERSTRSRLIDCVGSVLHEYLSTEIWDLPIDHKYSSVEPDYEDGDISLHFFRDTAVLHQEI